MAILIKTIERLVSVTIDGKETAVCSWSEGINRKENKPIAFIDLNHQFMEKRDIEELSKDDAIILVECLNLAISDAEQHEL